MEKWSVVPKKSVNGITFFSPRAVVRKLINLPYEEYLTSQFEENTMDVYENFHIMYDKNNRFNSILFFGDCEVLIDGNVVYPSSAKTTFGLLGDFEFDGYNYVEKKMSIGIILAEDELSIESIFFGCENYFSYLTS